LALFVRIPAEYWTLDAARTVARNKDTSFAQLPEQFRTPRIISDFVDADARRINEVPPDLLTKDVLVGLDETDFKIALKYAEPGRIADDVITEWLRGVHNTSLLDSFVNDLPERYFTEPVMRHLVDRGAISMSQIPADLMNDHTIYDRLTFRPGTIDELGAIPAEKFTIQLAERVARQYPGMVRRFPDHVLTGPVLRSLVKAITDDEERRARQSRNRYPYSVRHQLEEIDQNLAESVKAAFARFPASAWHGDDLAKMMQLKLFVPEISQIPLDVVNHSILELLAQQAPEQLAQVRATKRMEEEVIAAVRREPKVLLTINPKLLTEPVCYRALDRWAETYKHNGWAPDSRRYLSRVTDGDTLKQAIDRLPRKLWSQRCWDAAVTYVVSYEQVPEAFRNDQLTRTALLREPETIKAIPQPLAFLNQYIKQRDAGVDWYRAMEKLGFIRKGRGWISTESDLERTPVEGHPGFTVSVVEAGKNKRIYLYKDNEPVLVLHTKDGKVRLDKAWQYEEYRPVLIQVARDHLAEYDLGDLDRLKIFRVNGVIGGGEEQVKRERFKWTTRKHIRDPKDPWRTRYEDEEHVGQIDWTDVPRRNGHIYTAYLGNDKLMQVSTEGQGYRQVSTHEGTKIFDYQKALPHITEIWHFLQNNRVEFFWQLRDIGLTTKSKGWSSPEVSILAERKVGEAGDLTVWTNGSKVGLYGPQGYVGSGWLTARGKVTKVDVDYDYTKMKAKITEVLAKAARFIMAREGGQFDAPVTITPNKKEEKEAASEEAAEE
jgi:hypothetical protein